MSDSFTNGPAITSDLVAWFKGEGLGKTVQLPVVVHLTPLGITGGHVGLDAADQGLPLKLDDGAMSTSLHDHLRDLCGEAERCAVWLQGTWGANVAMPSFGPPSTGPTKHPFAVRMVIGKSSVRDQAVVRVVR